MQKSVKYWKQPQNKKIKITKRKSLEVQANCISGDFWFYLHFTENLNIVDRKQTPSGR